MKNLKILITTIGGLTSPELIYALKKMEKEKWKSTVLTHLSGQFVDQWWNIFRYRQIVLYLFLNASSNI